MSAVYQQALDFSVAVLRQMRLSVQRLHPQDSCVNLDLGLRQMLSLQDDYAGSYHFAQHWSDERTIYKITDQFMCHYIFLHLPQAQSASSLVVGPYLTQDPSREMLLEQTERLGLSPQHLQLQADFYASLPIFDDPAPIFAIMTCLGEAIWGSAESFRMVDVNYEQFTPLPGGHTVDTPIEQSDILQQMKQLEERYAYESQLMEIVSKGLTQQAEVMMSSVSMLNYQNRTPDPLRNIKNYCIICNTLLRKAAQSGGVHPLYLDRISGQYARRIETAPNLEKASALISEMVKAYCRLVQTHSSHHYTSPVQKTLTYIDANLSGDLSLPHLAALVQVSAGYLSTLFHRETGRTLAEHITSQRMKAALHLLQSSRLQIQTIAQLVGFSDPNYFGKQFKRFYGVTPLQYRSDQYFPAQRGSD